MIWHVLVTCTSWLYPSLTFLKLMLWMCFFILHTFMDNDGYGFVQQWDVPHSTHWFIISSFHHLVCYNHKLAHTPGQNYLEMGQKWSTFSVDPMDGWLQIQNDHQLVGPDGSRWLPHLLTPSCFPQQQIISGNHTWLAGKSPINTGQNGKIIYKSGMSNCYVWLMEGNHNPR